MSNDLAAAIELHRAGRRREAAQRYERILRDNPDEPEAAHMLGVLFHQEGNHDRAIELIGRAVALRPNVARYHANLAEVYRVRGQPDRAAGCCRMAIKLSPGYAEAHCNLGLALHGLGQTEWAIEAYRRALELKPGFAAAHNNLGNALRELGRSDEAVEQFRHAVHADPAYAPARTNLSQLLLERGLAGDALPHAQEAVRQQANVAAYRLNLGNVFRRLQKRTEAISAYLEALRLEPEMARAQAHLGEVLRQERRLEEAAHWLKLAVESEPGNDAYREQLAILYDEREEYANSIPLWQALLKAQPDRADIHNALGWALQEEGRLDEARKHYDEALRLHPRAAGAKLNVGGLLEELGDLKGAEHAFRESLRLNPDFPLPYARLAGLLRDRLPAADLAALERRLSHSPLDTQPRARLLFALAQVRDAHNDFAGAAACLQEANAVALEIGRGWREYSPAEHERFVDGLLREFTPQLFDRLASAGDESQRPVFVFGLPRAGTTLIEQILASHPRIHGAGEQRLARRAFESLPQLIGRSDSPVECVGRLDRPAVARLAGRYLRWLDELNLDGKDRVVDKMPDNYLYIGLLSLLFPNATFIHCRRDLRDVAVSCWMTDFRSIRWANDPGHIASRFKQYRRLMDHWDKCLKAPIHVADYEETVADLEGTAARLLCACGLPWDPACLEFFATRRPVRTASVSQVRQPLYSRSVGRWRNYAAPLQPLFAALDAIGAAASPISPAST